MFHDGLIPSVLLLLCVVLFVAPQRHAGSCTSLAAVKAALQERQSAIGLAGLMLSYHFFVISLLCPAATLILLAFWYRFAPFRGRSLVSCFSLGCHQTRSRLLACAAAVQPSFVRLRADFIAERTDRCVCVFVVVPGICGPGVVS